MKNKMWFLFDCKKCIKMKIFKIKWNGNGQLLKIEKKSKQKNSLQATIGKKNEC